MDENEVNNEEIEPKLEDVMDMKKVKDNEETPLGRTTMSVGREAATRPSESIEMVDEADKRVNEGVRNMEENQKNAQGKEDNGEEINEK